MKKNVNYWRLLLTGLVLIGVGIWIFASPLEAYVSLSILFATGVVIIGCMESAFSIWAKTYLEGWSWIFLGGIFDILLGGYLLMYPVVTFKVLPFIMGFWVLYRGFSAVSFAFDRKDSNATNWWLLLIIGILVIFFGVMVLAVPAFGALSIVEWTALSFIAAGIFRVLLAFKLRRLSPSSPYDF